MENDIKERKNGRKERDKKDRDFEQIYIYQIRRIRQNTEGRPNIKIKYEDQAHRGNTLNDKNDKDIVLGKRIDFGPFIE